MLVFCLFFKDDNSLKYYLLIEILLFKFMEFDILNELLTSTVYDLFTNTEKIAIECKPKVK